MFVVQLPPIMLIMIMLLWNQLWNYSARRRTTVQREDLLGGFGDIPAGIFPKLTYDYCKRK